VRKIDKLRPSPAMAVACLALFVAGAGSAAAAGGLLDGGDIKNNSLSSKDVKNGSLLKRDFKRGQIPAGPRGLQGPQGVAGPAGRAGRDGADGFGQLVYSQGIGETVGDGLLGDDVFAVCPSETFPTGGDAFYIDANDELVPQQQVAVQGIAVDQDDIPAGWVATPTQNASGGDLRLVVDVVCANASDLGFASTSQAKAKADGLERPARLQLQRP
jgi:hypothetical protein